MARLIFDCNEFYDSAQKPKIMLFEPQRNCVLIYHSEPHTRRPRYILTRINLQTRLAEVIYDGEYFCSVMSDLSGNIYLDLKGFVQKLLPGNKVEKLKANIADEFLFLEYDHPINCSYTNVNTKSTTSSKTKNYIDLNIPTRFPHLFKTQGINSLILPIEKFSKSHSFKLYSTESHSLDQHLLWRDFEHNGRFIITSGFQSNCQIITEHLELDHIDHVFIDQLDNIVNITKTHIEIYSDTFQLLDRIPHEMSFVVDETSFPIDICDKQLLYVQNKDIQLYVMDLPYRYWTSFTHKFYARYHPQIITIMTLSIILPYLNLMPIELWAVIFSEL